MPDTAPTNIYTLSLHDALPIYLITTLDKPQPQVEIEARIVQANKNYTRALGVQWGLDRKSTRLNSSHRCISYAVFCLKKKTLRVSDASKQLKLRRVQKNF